MTNPTVIINPIIVITFKVQPMKYITINEINRDNGIASVIILVMKILLRKKNNTNIAKNPPQSPLTLRSLTVVRM